MEHLMDLRTAEPQPTNRFALKVPGPVGELQLEVGKLLLLPQQVTKGPR